MTTKPKQNKTKKSKLNTKKDWSFYAIIICSVLISLPVVFFGSQAIMASMQGNKPILGNRFDGQFETVISKADMKAVEEKIAALDNVKSVSTTLITGTYRIGVTSEADVSSETINAISAAVYAATVEVLPANIYFTETDTNGGYDLEIAVHNGLLDDEENYILQVGTKNAEMEEIVYQYLTTPQSEDWVAEMWARQEAKDEAAAQKKNPDKEPEVPADTPEGEEGAGE